MEDAATGKTKTWRVTLGRYPVVGVAEARQLAEEARIEMARSKGKTLAEAWEDSRRELVADKASPRTVEGHEYGMGLLTDWADTAGDVPMNVEIGSWRRCRDHGRAACTVWSTAAMWSALSVRPG